MGQNPNYRHGPWWWFITFVWVLVVALIAAAVIHGMAGSPLLTGIVALVAIAFGLAFSLWSDS